MMANSSTLIGMASGSNQLVTQQVYCRPARPEPQDQDLTAPSTVRFSSKWWDN